MINLLIRRLHPLHGISTTATQPAIAGGRLVGVALACQTKRSAVMPGVPTFSEFGDPLLELSFSRSVYVPSGLPKDRQQILEKAFIKAQKKDFLLKARFDHYGIKPAMGNGKDAEAQVTRALKVAQHLAVEKLIKKKNNTQKS